MSNLRAILTHPMPKRDQNRNRSIGAGYERLARRFRATARRRGDKLGDIAARFGVTRQHFYYVLSGKRSSSALLDKITRYIEEGSE